MMRASTIERRLPELPPIPPKVPNIGENAENDYNGTYDTIKDSKKKSEGDKKREGDDPEYNSVEDTIGARREAPGGAVGGTASGAGMPNGDTGEDDYASVKGMYHRRERTSPLPLILNSLLKPCLAFCTMKRHNNAIN